MRYTVPATLPHPFHTVWGWGHKPLTIPQGVPLRPATNLPASSRVCAWIESAHPAMRSLFQQHPGLEEWAEVYGLPVYREDLEGGAA